MKILLIIQKIKDMFIKYDEIVSIEEYENNDVIDIEVDGNHLFYANELLTHNSGSGGGYAGADIDMSNVSESSGITATADALFALYQLEGERENGVINLKVLKNRLGGYVGSTIKFSVNYETLKIKDMIEEGNEQTDEEGVFNNAKNANDDLIKNNEIDNEINKTEHNILEDL